MQKDNKPRQDHRPGGKRLWLPVIALAGFIGFLLIYEHRAHIPTNAIFFLGFLLFCGVMHTFMHGGHGGHGTVHGRPDDHQHPSRLDDKTGPGK
ncbi:MULTISPECIES: DUF2933 domain-containing protein [Hyphomonas]|uniref:DUF2933 domain-containing protein n=1 Tax=Hyphomonas adhaerens TaxID=81029 RepID=A0A3B9H212_9PROT|nr:MULTISPECIES: DUF2933 domain-containing protein [Hyphomonas]MBB38503.1 hypothetical protein [Hyphomonas sp.]HAE28735.1 hypothetical protein [Hyphomonas adhaerens]|tara:strand:+ start:525 stop:806 length:282 start_codon:yes stop_codon:yes gene_type:complete